MPSFAALRDDDLEALVDYVIYLSVRGEVERRLAAAAIDELGYAETVPEEVDWRLKYGGDPTDGSDVIDEVHGACRPKLVGSVRRGRRRSFGRDVARPGT